MVQDTLHRLCTAARFPPRARASDFFYKNGTSGDAALRAANAGGGASSSRILAKLHSDLVSQFMELFVHYVQGLTKAVKRGGVSWSCGPFLFPPCTLRYFDRRRVLHRLEARARREGPSASTLAVRFRRAERRLFV